jgi:hypothetical protein
MVILSICTRPARDTLAQQDPQPFEICLQQRHVAGLIQPSRWMQHRNNQTVGDPLWDPVVAADADIGQPMPGCVSTQWHDDQRGNDGDLLLEKRPAGVYFDGCRITILWWAVFDNIGNKHLPPGEAGALQQAIEDSARRTHKRTTRSIFGSPGRLADQHHRCIGRPFAGHCVCRRCTECARTTGVDASGNLGEA